MNEQDVRALVREAIERHLGRPHQGARGEGRGVSLTGMPERYPLPISPNPSHPSHIILNVLSGGEADDGMCVIEPRVRCNHCGFCQSFGH